MSCCGSLEKEKMEHFQNPPNLAGRHFDIGVNLKPLTTFVLDRSGFGLSQLHIAIDKKLHSGILSSTK